MLIMNRKEGDWVEATHSASGDLLKFRLCNIHGHGAKARVRLIFDDPEFHFAINREERVVPERKDSSIVRAINSASLILLLATTGILLHILTST